MPTSPHDFTRILLCYVMLCYAMLCYSNVKPINSMHFGHHEYPGLRLDETMYHSLSKNQVTAPYHMTCTRKMLASRIVESASMQHSRHNRLCARR